MKFHILTQPGARPSVSKSWLEKRSQIVWKKILSATRKKTKYKFVGLVFVSSKEMQKLNKTYRGKNYATDVLSFSPVEPGSLGELVFCVDVLKRQARENKHSFQVELTYMLIHGLLHLLGYDHEASEAQAKKMFKIQDYIWHQVCFSHE